MEENRSLNSLPRFFTSDKTMRSRGANRLGSQVARTVLARLVHRARRARPDPSVLEDVSVLERDGMLVIPDFLPEATFAQVARRAEDIWKREQARIRPIQNGSTTLHVLGRREVELATEIPEFFAHPRLRAILEAVERRPGTFEREHQTIECLVQGPDGGYDYETDLHSDTFYSMHKAWLYLSDVTLESPPLVYVKRSHRLSAALLKGIYRESCAANTGSRRITPQEFEEQQLEETVLTCPRNTLAIANTFGYHRRLKGKAGQSRFALHVALRDQDPFRW